MADVVIMPKLGFDMAEGTLVRWVKGEGDEVQKGDVLAEIETDKATVEVESNFAGVLFKQLVETDTVVPVGTPIAVVAEPGEEPDLSEFTAADVEEGEEPGARPSEPVREMPEEGGPKDVVREEGPPPAAEGEEEAEEVETGDGRVKASPVARRIAEEQGVDLRRLQGSGPGGRIVRKDVEAAAETARTAPAAAPAAPAAPPAAPKEERPAPAAPEVVVPMPVWQAGQAQAPEDQRIEISRLRSIIGRRMTESRQTIPDFYVTSEYKMDKLMALRSQVNDLLPEDQKLSVNDFIVKAVAYGLRQFPNMNASLDGDRILRHGQVNVGIAVAVENGLMTVVVKNADQKPIRVISQEAKEMIARARQGKVRQDDIEGSTFSISNLGMYNVDDFVAIINPPEAAILAVGRVKQVPVVEDGEITIGQRVKMTISADHRLTDGAEAAQFMQALGPYIEEPMRLLV